MDERSDHHIERYRGFGHASCDRAFVGRGTQGLGLERTLGVSSDFLETNNKARQQSVRTTSRLLEAMMRFRVISVELLGISLDMIHEMQETTKSIIICPNHSARVWPLHAVSVHET